MNGNLHVFMLVPLLDERPQFILADEWRHKVGGDFVDQCLLTRIRVVPPFSRYCWQIAKRLRINETRIPFWGNVDIWKVGKLFEISKSRRNWEENPTANLLPS